MVKDWSDYFAAAYGGGGFSEGIKLGMDAQAKKAALDQQALDNKLAQDSYNLKVASENRRVKEGAVRTGILEDKQKFFNTIFGGGNLGGGLGANMPRGTTLSYGGLNIPLNPKYSDTEAKSLSGAGALLADLNEMKNMFQSRKVGKSAQGLGGIAMGASNIPLIGGIISGGAMGLAGIGDQGGNKQNYVDLSRNIANRLLYLRSGAQINEQEYKRFMAQLPALMRNDTLDVKQLDRFINEFSALEGRISSGALWDKNKKAFVGGEKPPAIDLNTLFDGLEAPAEEKD